MEKLIEKLKLLAAKQETDRTLSGDLDLVFGGNFVDCYNGGFDDGYISAQKDLAKEILNAIEEGKFKLCQCPH